MNNVIVDICKQVVQDSIDQDYLENCGTLQEVFMSEYGAFRMNVSPKTCMDYLQGLPSVCTVPFYNGEIYELLSKAGVEIPEDDDKAYDLIEAYWVECGKAFYNLIK